MTDQMLRHGAIEPRIIADAASAADRPGTCAVCGQRWQRGERIARLASDHGWAHAACCAQLAGQPG